MAVAMNAGTARSVPNRYGEPKRSTAGPPSSWPAGSAAVPGCRRRPRPMGRKGDHEVARSLSAEGQAPAASAGAALHHAAGPGGGAGHEPHALVAEHRWRLGRHDANRRDALPLQLRRLGAGLGGGIDHQAPLSRLPQVGLIGGAHREVGERPGCPQMPRGLGQLEQQGLIDAQRIGWIRPLIARDAMAEHDPGRQDRHLLDESCCFLYLGTSRCVPDSPRQSPRRRPVELVLRFVNSYCSHPATRAMSINLYKIERFTSMAEKFALDSNEAFVKSLLATWYKGAGGLNNQTGQMILTSQRLVFCARNRMLTAAVTGPILDQIVKSETIRWQIQVGDIDSISSFKRLGFKTNYRLKSKRWEGEEFVFTFNPGAGSTFEDWSTKVGLQITKDEESGNPSNAKPLSERPQGYLLALAGGLLGGAPGLIASPLVLLGLNNVLKPTDEKQPNRFRAWALIGSSSTTTSTPSSGDSSSVSQSTPETTAPATPPAPAPIADSWDSATNKSSLEDNIKAGMVSTFTGADQASVASVDCKATETKPIWHCAVRTLGEPAPTTYRIEVGENGEWAGQPIE